FTLVNSSVEIFPSDSHFVAFRKAILAPPMESSKRNTRTSPSHWPVSTTADGNESPKTYALKHFSLGSHTMTIVPSNSPTGPLKGKCLKMELPPGPSSLL